MTIMRPKTAVKLLLALSVALALCVIFLSQLKEVLRVMRPTTSEERSSFTGPWLTTETGDSETLATFPPSNTFRWTGVDENVVAVMEMKGEQWQLSYSAKPAARDETGQPAEGDTGGENHQPLQKEVREMTGEGLSVERRPPARTLEMAADEDLGPSDSVKEYKEVTADEDLEPSDSAADDIGPYSTTEFRESENELRYVIRSKPIISEQPSTQEKIIKSATIALSPLVITKDLKSKLPSHTAAESMTHTLPLTPASTSSGRDLLIRSYCSPPLPAYTQDDVYQESWVQNLKDYLRTLHNKQVSVVTANEVHEVVVLNWLISAVVVSNFTLENTLVLSLSRNLADLLRSKNIPVLYVHPYSIISKGARTVITSGFSQVHIVRLTVFRLINHLGYDLVWYDADATVLRNPQPLFDKYPDAGLVGSAGQGPGTLARVWGRTLCTGVLLMRSSQKMEVYWQKISATAGHGSFTDQGLVNHGLHVLRVRWPKNVRFSEDQIGHCATGLKAVILSEKLICRFTCDERLRSQYYVWHKRAVDKHRIVANKMDRAQSGHAWFLRADWRAKTGYSGVEWLRAISENTR